MATASGAGAPLPIVVTHRLSSQEAAAGEPALHPDLDALELAGTEKLPLVGGGGEAFIEHDRPGDGCVLTGPRGCFGDALAGGDLLSFTWDGSALAVTPVDDDEALAGEMAAALAGAFAAGGRSVAFLTDLLTAAAAEQPDLLARPQKPLGQMIEEAGLEYYEGLLGGPGTDWAALQAAQDRENELAVLGASHGLSRSGIEALTALVTALVTALAEPDAPDGTPAVPAVEDAAAVEDAGRLACEEGVAPALLAAVGHSMPAEHVERVAERWLRAGRGRQRAAALWVQASCAERRGDYARQEELLAEAVAANPAYRPALVDSSSYASDRGQAGRAASLLATAGLPKDHPWRAMLERYATPGPHRGERNEPCPCGSGRKSKACCLATNGWSLDARLGWLYEKAMTFLHRPAHKAQLDEVAAAWLEGAGAGGRGTDHPLVQDLALFEGGGLERFVEARGSLLPRDEATLAASWVGARARLCEVVEVRLDEGLVLEDLLTQDRLEVKERASARSLRRHQLVFVRVVPDGMGGLQLVGTVAPVRVGRHQSLLEVLGVGVGAADLARWWGAASAPLPPASSASEAGVLGRAVLAVEPNEGDVGASGPLSAALEQAGVRLLRGDEALDRRLVSGGVRLVGGRVVVEAGSQERLDQLVGIVRAALPEAKLLDRAVMPLTPALMAAAATPPVAEAAPAGEVGEDAAALVAQMREYEDRWVDEAIPALGGSTPRQAALDPARRRDLLRLLAEMEASSGGMDASRVRAMIGLDS